MTAYSSPIAFAHTKDITAPTKPKPWTAIK